MEPGNEVSPHEVRVFRALNAVTWATSQEVSTRADVAPRTARKHLTRLVQAGLVEEARVFPGHRFRLTAAATEGTDYTDRLAAAEDAMGIRP